MEHPRLLIAMKLQNRSDLQKNDKKTADCVLIYYCQPADPADIGLPAYADNH